MNAYTPPLPDEAAIDRTTRHLRMCRELAELGMDLARNAAQAARHEWTQTEPPSAPSTQETPPTPQPEPTAAPPRQPNRAHTPLYLTASPSLAFTRLAHCVRLVIALEIRIAADHTAAAQRAATRAADLAWRATEAARPRRTPEPPPTPDFASNFAPDFAPDQDPDQDPNPETIPEAELASLLDQVRSMSANYPTPPQRYRLPSYLQTPPPPPSG